MVKIAVIKTGGKQYLVKENDSIIVDRINTDDKKIELETLAVFEDNGDTVAIGKPFLTERTSAQIEENIKGDKIRVAKFHAKVRYRRVRGFRAQLTKLKIGKI